MSRQLLPTLPVLSLAPPSMPVFLGPELSAGRARGARHGSEFGVMWGAQPRFALGWGS